MAAAMVNGNFLPSLSVAYPVIRVPIIHPGTASCRSSQVVPPINRKRVKEGDGTGEDSDIETEEQSAKGGDHADEEYIGLLLMYAIPKSISTNVGVAAIV